MWRRAKPKEMVEVRGTVRRFGVSPFEDGYRGHVILLEGDNIPYIVRENIYRDAPTLVELTAPGDVVAFTVEKGYRQASNFRNESLPTGLESNMSFQ